jgi:hypothetical protein
VVIFAAGVGGEWPAVRAFRDAFLAIAVLAARLRFGDEAVFIF